MSTKRNTIKSIVLGIIAIAIAITITITIISYGIRADVSKGDVGLGNGRDLKQCALLLRTDLRAAAARGTLLRGAALKGLNLKDLNPKGGGLRALDTQLV